MANRDVRRESMNEGGGGVRRPSSSAVTLIALIALAAVTVGFGRAEADTANRPEVIPLPNGFQPEGVATHGNSFYVGSIPTGAIYRGDLRTGRGTILVAGQEGRSAIGLSLARGRVFVAGGETGRAFVYDARAGAELANVQLTTAETFVNDVVATRDAAYFTDSVNPVLYKLPLERHGGFGAVETIPLSGDLVYEEGFNANGIDATPNGKSLVVVQSNTGELFQVDPRSGASEEVDLGGETVTNGDGILLDGRRRLWVVQNQDNLLTLLRVNPDLSSGVVVARTTHESFDVPTTLARSGSRLALVNARFGTPNPETAEYWVSQIRR
jgi:sugar lactone lactonase YvrE